MVQFEVVYNPLLFEEYILERPHDVLDPFNVMVALFLPASLEEILFESRRHFEEAGVVPF
jgi:hypothetical protein